MKVTCEHGQEKIFGVRSGYIYDQTKSTPSGWRQICHGGGYRGSTIIATGDDIEAPVMDWLKARLHNILNSPYESQCVLCGKEVDWEGRALEDVIRIE